MTSKIDNHEDNEPQLPAAYDCRFFKELESLADKAAELANNEAEEGCLVWCHHQLNAQARPGKNWICNDGDMHCSIILRPEFALCDYHQMLVVAIVSLGNSIASYVSPMTALGYRWPNDICIANHKIASIWLQQGESGDGCWLTITLSVNVLNAPEDPKINAISIREIEGTTDLNNKRLLESFAREFIKQINNWSQRGHQYVYDQWRMRLDLTDQTLWHTDGTQARNLTEVKLDDVGNIEVTNDGKVETIRIGKYMGLSE